MSKSELQSKIKALEAQIEPLEKELDSLIEGEQKSVKSRIKLAERGNGDFKLDELTFAAFTRCACGAGMAYPSGCGINGAWYCSDILRGLAKPKSDPESKQHDGAMPFVFWEVKSENQPSANGATTRPKE